MLDKISVSDWEARTIEAAMTTDSEVIIVFEGKAYTVLSFRYGQCDEEEKPLDEINALKMGIITVNELSPDGKKQLAQLKVDCVKRIKELQLEISRIDKELEYLS